MNKVLFMFIGTCALMFSTLSVNCSADDEKIEIPIEIKSSQGTTIFRSPARTLIHCYYLPSSSCFCFYFLDDLGACHLLVEDSERNKIMEDFFAVGRQIIPAPTLKGACEITIETKDGTEYYGSFVL